MSSLAWYFVFREIIIKIQCNNFNVVKQKWIIESDGFSGVTIFSCHLSQKRRYKTKVIKGDEEFYGKRL